MTVIYRLLAVLLQLVLVIDELGQVFLRSPIYILTGHNLPSAHETISAWVGASAAAGQRWAIEAAKLLDSIFGVNHCLRAARHESTIETPVN
jgi:hypothetical protein